MRCPRFNPSPTTNRSNFTTRPPPTIPSPLSHHLHHRPSPSSSSSSISFRFNSTFSVPQRGGDICCRCSVLQDEQQLQQQTEVTETATATATATTSVRRDGGEGEGGGGEGYGTPSQIQVPRQSYIPVSKKDLLEALVSVLDSRDSDEDDSSLTRHFLILSSCLDFILHAEHKAILEEMRADYSLYSSDKLDKGNSQEDGKGEEALEAGSFNGNGSIGSFSDDVMDSKNQMPWNYQLGALQIPACGKKGKSSQGNSVSRVETVTRFQRSFMELLSNAQFEELSVRDLLLTSALNSDYLLTLPIYVDWKKASEANAVIFRRGFVTEKQKGFLVVEKLDYLQSKLLQQAFRFISKPLRIVGLWIKKAVESGSQESEIQILLKRFQLWLEELSQGLNSYKEQASNSAAFLDHELDANLPIWLAAQRAASRYEGLLSSVGPRGRLLRKFLTSMGLIQSVDSVPETPVELRHENGTAAVEPYLRPVSISRITLTDIWRPATSKYCGNDIWRMLKTAISIIFSRSVLQEPAFYQLILLTEETSEDETGDGIEIPSLQLRIFEKIPIPDLPVIFPNKKLSFRILDTVRLDIATIVGLLAYFINYKFEDVLSSPSAVVLDAIAASALIIYVTRVALGYKQTWDRYQLLVNKTLYTKTLASGFGTVHFLLDASEQQQYKECILAYAMLLNAEKDQVINRSILGEKCERFLYDAFKEKIVMPINKAVDTLKKCGLVIEDTSNGEAVLLVVPFSTAYDDLKHKWDCLLG